jgi:opacity protein-like surface antigen
MIKKSLYLFPFVVSAFANAQDGFYTSLYSGATFSSKTKVSTTLSTTSGSSATNVSANLKSSPVFGAAIGYNYQDVSFELSYDTRSAKDKENDIETKSNIILANAVYNFNIANPNIKPYVGLGLGLAQSQEKSINNSDISVKNSLGVDTTQKLKNAFAMQLKGGAKVYLTQNVAIFGDLRYTSLAKAGYKNADQMNLLLESDSAKSSINYFSANVGVSYFF